MIKMKNKENMKQTWKLASILGITGLNGHAALAALSGLFTLENVPILAVALMAGPGAIITASLLQGTTRERMLIAMLAGVIATGMVTFAAGLGPGLFRFVNKDIIRIAGGISIALIAVMIIGVKMPQLTPLGVMLIGLVAAVIWR